ncbi:hypothetical protein [Nocardioides cynanchi]|uniref:hypothetical protein n=1 Tax=Nocardioides cynanchi TaxID=2558918 RepID=UPI0012454AC9|nr:hypothetical protein [Nocardioides cynanchi]
MSLLPAARTIAAGEATAAPSRSTVTIPAYADRRRLRATLPGGGVVTYRLPRPAADGIRLMGDWDGDGAQTPGLFTDGRWKLWNRVVRTGSPAVRSTFGQAGDLPLTGDWNGDGVTDIGLVRGSEWILALGPLPTDDSQPVIWQDVTFGSPGAHPVTGDWDGDGADGIGTFSDGTWLLVNSPTDPTGAVTVSYGAAGDAPVTGDWDGDGTDGIGVARGSTWFLSNSALAPRTSTREDRIRAGTDLATTWQVPVAGPDPTCPTARSGTVGNPAWVVPSPVLDRAFTPPRGTLRQVRGSLQQSERYLLGAQYDAKWRSTSTRPYLTLIGGVREDELNIRLPAMSALTVAIGLRTGGADPAHIDATSTTATRYVDQLVRSIACQHRSVSPGGWGDGWETAHWAMLTGAAAWLLWDRLTPATRADVASMVASEADFWVARGVSYWGLPDGTILTPGDTKAESSAWNAAFLSFAGSMMPSAPHAALWRAKAAELAVAAYSVPADDTSSTVVNGVALADRLEGFNAYADGTVENHGRIHPDYASCVQLLWLAADFARLARQRVPAAMFHNGGLVYSAFSTVDYQAGATSPAGGTFAPPGGSVYVRGKQTIYYPQGDDWGRARRAHFVSLDAHALVYSTYLGAHGWPAAAALTQHEKAQRHLWRTSGTDDGRTYSVDPAVASRQDTYPGREEYAAQNLATAWLALYVAHLGIPALDSGILAVPDSTAPAVRPPASAVAGP